MVLANAARNDGYRGSNDGDAEQMPSGTLPRVCRGIVHLDPLS
jgi:hypothetical protein